MDQKHIETSLKQRCASSLGGVPDDYMDATMGNTHRGALVIVFLEGASKPEFATVISGGGDSSVRDRQIIIDETGDRLLQCLIASNQSPTYLRFDEVVVPRAADEVEEKELVEAEVLLGD